MTISQLNTLFKWSIMDIMFKFYMKFKNTFYVIVRTVCHFSQREMKLKNAKFLHSYNSLIKRLLQFS